MENGKKTSKEYNAERTERRRKEREERLKEMNRGTTEGRNLSFIRTVLENRGLDNADLVRLTGMKKQLLHYYLNVHDDCKLSTAEKICEGLGYSLSFTIKKRGTQQKKFINREASGMPEELKRCAEDESKRLHKLAEFIIDKEYSATDIGVRTKIDRAFFYRAFQNDDTSISYIIKIAQTYGNHVTWILTPKKENENSMSVQAGKRNADTNTDTVRDNLSFIRETITETGTELETIADNAGTDRQKLYYKIYATDDCKLSEAESYMATMGKELKYTLTKERELGEKQRNAGARLPEYAADLEGSRLAPIADIIRTTSLSLYGISKTVKIPLSTLKYDLISKDMPISRLRRLTTGLGYTIEWKY